MKNNSDKKEKRLYPMRASVPFVPALACLAYYFVVLTRGGPHTSVIWVWLAGCAFFAAVGAIFLIFGKIPLNDQLCLVAVILVLSLFGSFFIFEGALVNGEQPSPALARRIEAAYDYLERNPQTVAVLSGGMGDGESITEAECMRRELTARGISEDRLILEDKSRDTAENIKNTLAIIGDRYGSIALVTNNFHIYRAIRLAEAATDIPVYGIGAPFNSPLIVHFAVREYIGMCHDTLRGNV